MAHVKHRLQLAHGYPESRVVKRNPSGGPARSTSRLRPDAVLPKDRSKARPGDRMADVSRGTSRSSRRTPRFPGGIMIRDLLPETPADGGVWDLAVGIAVVARRNLFDEVCYIRVLWRSRTL